MNNKIIEIGKVIEINGLQVQVETLNVCNDLTYYNQGCIYNGVTVGAYVGIIRGPLLLVGRIEREYLVDVYKNSNIETYGASHISRRFDIRMTGYFEGKNFVVGLISYPMIYNKVILLSDETVISILSGKKIDRNENIIKIGRSINEKIDISLDATKVFNTHIGIFGNTGSGKSNTLAKLYTELFNKYPSELNLKNSQFVFLDFNGEYVNDKIFFEDNKNKKVLKISTHSSLGSKIQISKKQFWDIETLSILFSATEKTQKPFLKNSVEFFLNDDYDITSDKIIEGISSAFYNTFFTNSLEETNNLLHLIYNIIGVDEKNNDIPFYLALWNSCTFSYYLKNKGKKDDYINAEKGNISEKRRCLDIKLNRFYKSKIDNLKIMEKLKIALYSQMIFKLSYGQVNYEHISPLLSRVQSDCKDLNKVISIEEETDKKIVTVISLKDCNINMKKKLSLLLAKDYYNRHKLENKDKLNKTFHLIIDEAHNILSDQSSREASTWKDYRLEVFEEIIKEGRKFGFYITLASQRPADISITLVSQLHNYFIHRLVSDKDLRIIDNTINTLDSVSKNSIPSLAPGQCIITGTSFSLPIAVKIDKLTDKQSPNSANADLEELWLVEEDDLDFLD